MKRLLSLILLTLVLAGCAGLTAAAEADFADCVEAQAFAVAMAYHEGGFLNGITPADPAFLWEATGWYAARLYRIDGQELLDREQVRDFQRSLGNRDEPAMPESWLNNCLGARTLRGAGGALFYDFYGYRDRIDSLLGQTLEFGLDAAEPAEVTATLRQHYSSLAVDERCYSLSFTRNRDAGSAFPYSLRNAVAPDPGPALDATLDFDWAGLLAANSLENILALAPALRVQGDFSDGSTWLWRRAGSLCLVHDGADYVGGQYRGCFFTLEEGEDGGQRVRVSDFGEDGAGLDGYVTDYLQGAAIVQDGGTDGDLRLLNVTYTGDWLQELAVDRGTLLLRETRTRLDEETPPFVTAFTYTETPPDYAFLSGWERPLRHVTLVWEDWRDGSRRVRTEVRALPDDWEYLPWEGLWGDYTIYLNEGYTRLYSYPGDGTDYTLYLTTAKG